LFTINDLDEIGMTDDEITAALGLAEGVKASVAVDTLVAESDRRVAKAARGVRRIA
jgi:hypothetical protein